jgi:anti-sigma factor RsiW
MGRGRPSPARGLRSSTMSHRLTCREFVEFLADYLEGRLPQERLASFNRHLAGCPSCVAYARSYQDAVRLGREALRGPDEPVPADVPEELVRAILAARDEIP